MTKRLFISIALPQEWQDAFVEYYKQFPRNDVRWTPKENIHITACFLGDVQEERIGEIKEKIKELCAHIVPFPLSFEKMSFAPPGMSPRMVWAVFQKSDAYAQLVKDMQDVLHNFLAVEPHKETIPHATLARLNFERQNFGGRARFKDPALAREIDVTGSQLALGSFEVRSVELMESRLDPAGVRHEKLEVFPLSAHA